MPQRANPFAPVYGCLNAGDGPDRLRNIPPFPRLLDVELTNACNFHCLMCHTGTSAISRGTGFLTEALYRKLLDEIRPYRTPLRFIRWGEPTLHPQWLEFMAMAKAQGSLVHFNTNGSRLTSEAMASILRLGIDSLKFSLQGIDARSYAQMRNVDFFEELLDIAARFKALRGDAISPFLHVSTTVTWETPEMVEAFVRRVSPLVDLVTVGKTVLDHIPLDKVRLSPEEIDRLAMLKECQSVSRRHPICPEVFGKLSMNWDGTISACCGDYDNLMLVGDLAQDSLENIWRSRRMRAYQEILASMEHDRLPLCRHCWEKFEPPAPRDQAGEPEA